MNEILETRENLEKLLKEVVFYLEDAQENDKDKFIFLKEFAHSLGQYDHQYHSSIVKDTIELVSSFDFVALLQPGPLTTGISQYMKNITREFYVQLYHRILFKHPSFFEHTERMVRRQLSKHIVEWGLSSEEREVIQTTLEKEDIYFVMTTYLLFTVSNNFQLVIDTLLLGVSGDIQLSRGILAQEEEKVNYSTKGFVNGVREVFTKIYSKRDDHRGKTK